MRLSTLTGLTGLILIAGCAGRGSSGGSFATTTAATTSRSTGGGAPRTPATPTSPTTGGSLLAALPLPDGPAGGARAQGVDVSYYEGKVDWARAAGTGLGFGIARVSDGKNTHDATFLPNWNGMKAQGLCRGVYQFFRPSQDPIVQADYMLSQIGTLGPGDLPPFCDVETLDGVSAAQVTANLATWIAYVKQKTGVTPAIYSSKRVWNLLNNPTGFSDSDLWVANWGVTSPALPPIWRDWTFWQYTASGVVAGVTGSPGVDCSVFNGSLDDLHAYAGLPVPDGFFRGLAVDSTSKGLWTCAYDGGVFAYGDATFRGTAGGKKHPEPILGVVRTPTGYGYWLFRKDGAVLAFGDAVQAGDLSATALASPIVAMAATPSGKGYWLVAQDGGVAPFGDATSVGTASPQGTTVGVAATATGKGYWIASAQGAVQAFGDAPSLGDVASAIVSPVTAIAATPSGQGYWVLESNGTVHAFGDAPALAATSASSAPRVAIAGTLTGKGYWVLGSDGSLAAAGDAVSVGSRPR